MSVSGRHLQQVKSNASTGMGSGQAPDHLSVSRRQLKQEQRGSDTRDGGSSTAGASSGTGSQGGGAVHEWALKSDDFFPYADNPGQYWTGGRTGPGKGAWAE
jgi:hypothetical protein